MREDRSGKLERMMEITKLSSSRIINVELNFTTSNMSLD